ncbi:MAG: amino acid adenylation domain-containing protein, partial [Alphaproteobacteria bacterium]|nr:amino acid adenylation domain-containing protein [Alphaproteobacteria bacterium]
STYLSIVIHHIAFDGWSTDIFLKELQEYYRYYKNKSEGLEAKLNLANLVIQYKDFALWQRHYLTGPRLEKQINYWKSHLSNYETLNLITDKPRPSQIDYTGADVYFEIEENTSRSLRTLAKELKVSLYSLLLASYYLMLRVYSNQDDIVIGTPVANRHYSQIENLIGFFVNSLALRTTIDSKVKLRDFIQQIGNQVVEAQLHQDLPFEKLVEELDIAKDTSRHPIFQVMFGLQSFGNGIDQQPKDQTDANLANLLESYRAQDTLYNIAKFDISTFIDDSSEKLQGSFNYATGLYNEETITRFLETYTEILNQVAGLASNAQKQEQTKIQNLVYLSQPQYSQIVETWNKTEKTYPDNKTIHQLFEEQVEKTPDSIAVVYEDTKLSYRELNNKANRLANYLRRDNNILPDTLIVLCLERSEDMLISILAVLKAGAAYVPMDPNYPTERIRYILEDTRTKIVLTNEIHKQRLEGISEEIVLSITDKEEIRILDAANQRNILAVDSQEIREQLSLELATNPRTETTSRNLAYVIYTSGTTGKPKGVMQLHGNIMRLFIATDNLYKFHSNDIWTLFHSYIFDFSVWEIWGALIYGGQLIVPSYNKTRDLNIFYELCKQERVTVLNQTPSAFYQFIDIAISKDTQDKLHHLRHVIFGGEALNLTQLKPWFDYYSYTQPQLINMYGITETTIHVTYKLIEKQDLGNSSYIGNVIPDLKAYVLSNTLTPLPIGAIGELYIGGAGLARGYLNQPDLTSERFIPNPFQNLEERNDKSFKSRGNNTRLYKTGDLVRWLPDGNLEYIGRNDFQIKIRGYRIEVGEIESALASYDGIKQAIVIAKEHNRDDVSLRDDTSFATTKYLVAYYTSDTKLNEEEVLVYLQNKLPEYMVPTILVHLTSLPLTVNGKLDRRALPDPEFTNRDNYIAPRNELERKVCDIWAEVLGLPSDKVGICDDFFRMGGDSIMSIQLVSRLRQRLGLYISVKDIFSYKTIKRLFDNVITKTSINSLEPNFITEQGVLSGNVPLLPIQRWFFESNFKALNHWNQSFIINTPNLDITILQFSVVKLIEHHDSFRLRYKKNQVIPTCSTLTDITTAINTTGTDSPYIQFYDDVKPEELKILDIKTLTNKEGSLGFEAELQIILTNWQSNFNIEQGPTYSIGYIYGYNDGSARIWFALHHLIVDTISWRILTEDLKDIYDQKNLGSKGSSYRQWVNAIKEYATTHEAERNYWINILSSNEFDNKSNFSRLVTDKNTQYSSVQLTQEQTTLLLKESNKAYHTEVNDILLTALGYALSEVTGSSIHHITLEGHGREEINNRIDITRTLGWFTIMYPVRLEVLEDIGGSLQNMKESLRQVPNKGIGYGALIGYDSSQLPKISFNYLGQFDKEDKPQDSNINFWSITNEGSGLSISQDNQDHNIININGLVIDGILQFSISSKLSKDVTIKLAESFRQKLEEIIAYTVKQTRSYLTSSDIDNIISQEHLSKLQEFKEIEGVYFANSLQQGFIYHALNQGDIDDAYLVQVIWEYNRVIDVEALRQAWNYAQKRYSALRLRFDWEEELIQIIDKKGVVEWRFIDISDQLDSGIREQRFKAIQKQDRLEPYNLQKSGLFRIYIIKQREDYYNCIFSHHHAILDG